LSNLLICGKTLQVDYRLVASIKEVNLNKEVIKIYKLQSNRN